MDLPTVSNSLPDDYSGNKPSLMPKKYINEDVGLDVHSRKGKFGWTTIGGVHFPFLIRNKRKYLSVRMVSKGLMNKYIRKLSSHVYSNNRIKAYFITNSEAILLNEINKKHLDGIYGRGRFTTKDLITELYDTIQFFNFIHFCLVKVSNTHILLKSNCGFIQIGTKIVPYIQINGNKFVPTLFFDGIAESLKNKSINVESWNWAYLKLYCKILGMEHTDIPSNSCPVISVADIQNALKLTEEYEFVAPYVVTDSCALVRNQNSVTIPWFII